jgi:hypothetical protein
VAWRPDRQRRSGCFKIAPTGFAESGEPVPLDKPDSEGFQWRLRTLHEFLSSYAHRPIPEMLAPDGSRCGPYTRGVLRRRPVWDGERRLVLKEAVVYGDNPRRAFSVRLPEAGPPAERSRSRRRLRGLGKHN